MADTPQQKVLISNFPGLINSVDEESIPIGAGQIQTNATCVKMAQLQIRQGLRELTFEQEP